MLRLDRLQPYSQTLDEAGKTFQYKHSSLLRTFVIYGRKKFYNICPWLDYRESLSMSNFSELPLVKIIKIFYSSSLLICHTKLECWSYSNIFSNTLGQCYKTFYGRKLRIFKISWSVCPWQTFPAKSNVCGYGRSLPEWSTFQSSLLALPTNIRQGWKGLQETNTPAHFENS